MFLSLNENFKKYFLIFFFLSISIFIFFYLKNFFFREEIIFYNLPENNQLLVNSNQFVLTGKAKHIKEIKVNKKEYFLDQKGNFNINLNLFEGENIFIFKALSESDKEFKKKFLIFRKK